MNDVVNVLKSILDMIFTDCAQVCRSKPMLKEDGTTVMRYEKVHDEVKCRLSRLFSRKELLDSVEFSSIVEHDAMLYYFTDIEILPGDRISVTREEKSWEFLAGEAHYQHSHCELPLKRVVHS